MARGHQRLAAGALTWLIAAGLMAGPGALCLPANAQDASVGSFPDMPIDHWAFLTVELLVRKYKVMAGFPDGTFGGDKEVSRYELAAALNKVVERMDAMLAAGQPVSPADAQAVKEVQAKLDLKDVADRVDKLEAAIKEITDHPPGTVKLSGHSGATWIDNIQDSIDPFITSGFNINIKTQVLDKIDLSAGMGGTLAAQTAGNKPATAGSGKPPTGAFNFGGASLTAHPLGSDLRVGLFSPDAFFGPGSSIDDHWGAMGFQDLGRNTTRWGDKNVAIATTGQIGGLKGSAAITPEVIVGGLDYQPFEFLRMKIAGDTDQPDWGNLFGSNRILAHNLFGVIDLGSKHLGLSLQGDFAKDLFQGSTEVVWTPLGDAQIGLGLIYRTSDKGVTEVTPGATLYLPSFAIWEPALTFGIQEPEVIATDHGNTGPGSLLGALAGVDVSAEWSLDSLGFPNISFDYNIQQPVLLYQTYDATFSFRVGRDF